MPDADWLDTDPWPEILGELTDDVVARYRISWPQAEQMIRDSLASNSQLCQAGAANPSAAKVKRTRVFKDAASEAKRNVYYHLRAYRAQEEQLTQLITSLRQVTPETAPDERDQAVAAILASHASSRERWAGRDDFYRNLFASVASPRSVLDIGCGVHPLMFPFDAEWSRRVECYFALDSNPQDIACVEAFANARQFQGKLVPVRWDLAEGWSGILERARCDSFDLAFLMKIVPVVERQHRELLPLLCETPATTWLLTGSRISLTKHVSIERREKRVLEEFVRRAGRVVQHEFVVGEEFAWVVTKPAADT